MKKKTISMYTHKTHINISTEPLHKKTNNLHMRKQRRRSAVQLPLFSLHREFNPSFLKSEISRFCDSTVQFVSDLVRNPNCLFSHSKALLKLISLHLQFTLIKLFHEQK